MGSLYSSKKIPSEVNRINNIIRVSGSFEEGHLSYVLANIFQAFEKAAYEEIILDFSHCTSAFAPAILPLCAQAIARREQGQYMKLELPEDKELQKLFVNCNWAYFIDPRRYDKSQKEISVLHIPATQYKNSADQHETVSKIVKVLLNIITGLDRKDLSAFEWSLNEITDNVLTHSESSIGGLVQLSYLKKKDKVQFIVADAGIGIPKSMRSGEYSGYKDDVNLLQLAIKEGVTRDRKIGQGNGLFGSYQIVSMCSGYFHIKSGNADLKYTASRGLHIKNDKIPYNGTLVVGEIGFSNPGLLAEALKIKGKTHSPAYDIIEKEYTANDDHLMIVLQQEAESFGSRPAGTPLRTKLVNLIKMGVSNEIRIDCDGVPIMSSSFADEVFGKLCLEIGPMDFMSKIKFINLEPTCKSLIDKAIMQRLKAGQTN